MTFPPQTKAICPHEQISITVVRHLRSQFKRGRICLFSGFLDFRLSVHSPCPLDSEPIRRKNVMFVEACSRDYLIYDGKAKMENDGETERGWEGGQRESEEETPKTRYNTSSLLPLAKLYYLKFPEPSTEESLAKDQPVQYLSSRGKQRKSTSQPVLEANEPASSEE